MRRTEKHWMCTPSINYEAVRLHFDRRLLHFKMNEVIRIFITAFECILKNSLNLECKKLAENWNALFWKSSEILSFYLELQRLFHSSTDQPFVDSLSQIKFKYDKNSSFHSFNSMILLFFFCNFVTFMFHFNRKLSSLFDSCDKGK